MKGAMMLPYTTISLFRFKALLFGATDQVSGMYDSLILYLDNARILPVLLFTRHQVLRPGTLAVEPSHLGLLVQLASEGTA